MTGQMEQARDPGRVCGASHAASIQRFRAVATVMLNARREARPRALHRGFAPVRRHHDAAPGRRIDPWHRQAGRIPASRFHPIPRRGSIARTTLP